MSLTPRQREMVNGKRPARKRQRRDCYCEVDAAYWQRLMEHMRTWEPVDESPVDEPEPLF